MEQLKKRFAQLSEREQKMVAIAVVFVTIGLIYALIYAPITNSIETNRLAVKSQSELLTWVKQNANKVIQLRSSNSGASNFNGSLPQTVNQTAARFDITITRMQPQGDEIQVWVDNARFNDVIAWLNAIEQTGISIVEADISESDVPGNIKVRRLKLSKI
ncbi:MAG: type II secretion system protein GspM [Aestuariibacter sp.]